MAFATSYVGYVNVDESIGYAPASLAAHVGEELGDGTMPLAFTLPRTTVGSAYAAAIGLQLALMEQRRLAIEALGATRRARTRRMTVLGPFPTITVARERTSNTPA